MKGRGFLRRRNPIPGRRQHSRDGGEVLYTGHDAAAVHEHAAGLLILFRRKRTVQAKSRCFGIPRAREYTFFKEGRPARLPVPGDSSAGRASYYCGIGGRRGCSAVGSGSRHLEKGGASPRSRHFRHQRRKFNGARPGGVPQGSVGSRPSEVFDHCGSRAYLLYRTRSRTSASAEERSTPKR